ncbi:hypothetical protein [Phenylobacterium sp.]|uniref:hypothetical protein n=1 Tax=Phenylobacterium sp. TaxID=1871053 RepID=UPI0025E435B3|nr:hypothetical protein [Phenylobacterium sp.]
MKYHLDRRVILNPDSKHKNLYRWSLNEVADGPGRVATEQIPWGWSLYFGMHDLQHFHEDWLDRYSSPNPDAPTPRSREFIRANLLPQPATDAGYSETYSMFGTDRRIEDITIGIYSAGDGHPEGCQVYSGSSYTTDVDFRDITVPDNIAFSITLSSERFGALARAVACGDVTGGRLMVSGISGYDAKRSL